jgi:phage shock protein C
MDKRLYRSGTDRVIAGVCGGLAEYLNVDANLVRLLWVVISFPGAIGLPLYILAWILVPEVPGPVNERPAGEAAQRSAGSAARWLGAILFLLGGLLLLQNLMPWFHWGRLWPVVLLVAGAALLMRGRRG